MGKRQVVDGVLDSAKQKLIAMTKEFSLETAICWLREKFPSFETSQRRPLDFEGKSEPDHFVSATLLGYVAKLPEKIGADAVNKPLLIAAVKMKGVITERTSRSVQFNFAKRVLRDAVNYGATGLSGLPSQGLFFFHDKNGNFRLSLVTGEVEGRRFKFNEAKRQSFYIEPDAQNNIVRRRFYDDIKTFADLKDVFSVEKLTKEFYKRLFDWYTWAMDSGVTFPNVLNAPKDKKKESEYTNEAIIRLITRLMFTWFIRQKNLVPAELFDKEALGGFLQSFKPDSMSDDNYYRAILQNLFFATFNTPQDGGGKIVRRWINAKTDENGNGVGLSDDYNVATVYRYRDEVKNPDAFLAMMKKVPFLNCALFDCLDKIEDEEDGGRKLYFDGFSSKKARQAHVPNGLFFGNGDDGRLGIIKLFSEYEFTIDENDADDADVSLDPELLGKVFENLLGAYNPETQATARNATGSFYTPREIVDYMVEESLKSYLRGRCGRAGRASLPRDEVGSRVPRDRNDEPPGDEVGSRVPRDRNDDFDAKLDNLFDKAKAAERAPTGFSRDEEKAILDALYSAKIIDPACGSGAFPMGVLHTMIRLMKRLDPDNTSIRGHLLERYKADRAANDPAETEEERKDRLEELEKRLKEGQHYPDYERKLYLIENCIYGVDIQPIAAQISKLRFFISLLCDQFRTSYDLDKENYGLLTLPNLEAKFVCANTLISLPDTASELDLTVGEVHKLRKDLVQNRHRIFGARSTKTKEKYKTRDREIRRAIRSAVVNGLAKPDEKKIAMLEAQMANALKRRKDVEKPDWQEVEKPVQQDFFSATVVQPMMIKIDRNAEKRDRIDGEISSLEKDIAKERSKSSSANVSAAQDYANLVAGWDPFDQNASSPFFDPKWMFNISEGFDVVIGNPPYVKLETIKQESRELEQEGYKVFNKRSDLYCLFTERGFRLLCKDGIISYIMSNKWLQAEYGRPLRKYFLENKLQTIIDFGDNDLFEGATVYPCIFIASRTSPDKYLDCVYMNCYRSESFASDIRQWTEKIPVGRLSEETWILSKVTLEILERISTGCTTLGEYVEGVACRGILTGATDAFIISEETKRQIVSEDIKARKIICPMIRGKDASRYSAIHTVAWLIGTHNGYGETPPIDINDYPTVKKWLDKFMTTLKKRSDQGVTPYNLRDCAYWEVFKHPKIMYQVFQVSPCFIFDETGLYCNNSMWIIPTTDKALVGILNSKMGWWLISKFCTQIQNGYQLIWQYLNKIPIPKELPKELTTLVDRILAAKKKDPKADTIALEAEIDKLVYKLYGITDEKEIAMIEGRKVGDSGGGGDGWARSPNAPSGARNGGRGAGGHAGRMTLPGGGRGGALRTTRPTKRNDDDEMLD